MNTRTYLFLIMLVFSWIAQPASAQAHGRPPGGDIETKWMPDIGVPGKLVFTETGALVGERTSIPWQESGWLVPGAQGEDNEEFVLVLDALDLSSCHCPAGRICPPILFYYCDLRDILTDYAWRDLLRM